MKKINAILCACALVCAAVFVSCANEPTEMINVTTKSYERTFTVSGSITEVTEEVISGTSGSTTTKTTKTEFNGGYGKVTWTESEVTESNYNTYTVSYGGPAKVTESETEGSVTNSTTSSTTADYSITVYEIDDEMYLSDAGDFVSAGGPYDFDADSFTVAYTVSNTEKSPYGTETDTVTKKVTVNLTFTAIK